MRGIRDLVADLTSRDESAAEAAACELASRGEAGTAALVQLLDSEEAEHRWWAVRTLAAMTRPRTDWLVRALGDPEAEVRAAAALALAAHPEETATGALVRALADVDGLVAILAVNALVKLGGPAVPQLLDAYDAAPARGRINIVRTLAELRDPRAIRVMMKAEETNSAVLQYWAQAGLERLGLDMVYLKPD